jgi:hypothetical protein
VHTKSRVFISEYAYAKSSIATENFPKQNRARYFSDIKAARLPIAQNANTTLSLRNSVGRATMQVAGLLTYDSFGFSLLV